MLRRTSATNREKQDAWKKSPDECFYCRRPIVYENNSCPSDHPETAWEVDHVIPRHPDGFEDYWDNVTDGRKEGDDHNLVAACCACNDQKDNGDVHDFIRELMVDGVDVDPAIDYLLELESNGILTSATAVTCLFPSSTLSRYLNDEI